MEMDLCRLWREEMIESASISDGHPRPKGSNISSSDASGANHTTKSVHNHSFESVPICNQFCYYGVKCTRHERCKRIHPLPFLCHGECKNEECQFIHKTESGWHPDRVEEINRRRARKVTHMVTIDKFTMRHIDHITFLKLKNVLIQEGYISK